MPATKMGVDLELWAIEKDCDLLPRGVRAGTFHCSGVKSPQHFGVMHHCRVPELRRISTFATAPFFSSTDASQPESLMTAPRNWLRLGLCPTTMIASCREYFSSSLRKSAKPALGRSAGVDLQLAFVANLIAHQRSGLSARFSGLETIASTCASSAARARPT